VAEIALRAVTNIAESALSVNCHSLSNAELREEIRQSAAETRGHMDMIAESLRDDLRMFADAIGLHSDRLNRHDARISRLERRSHAG
jgi:hypothetical protein